MAYAEIGALIAPGGRGGGARDPARGARVRRAARRYDKGLVTRVVPDDQVEAEALRHARSASPTARRWSARWHKKFARRLRDAAPAHRRRDRRGLRLLRHRGLPHRLPGLPRQEQAASSRANRIAMNSGRSQGIKVVELAQIMAGPTCGMLLADMGADVIKVEKLPGGDDTRSYREPSIARRVGGVHDAEPQQARHRGEPQDARRARGGASACSPTPTWSPRTTARARSRSWAWATRCCEKLNPRLVYCAVSGYGRTGPYADKGGFDLIAQGFAGLMSITGEPGGRAGEDRAPRSPTSTPASSPRWASSRRCYARAQHRARARWSRPRSWKRRSSRPTGSRRSTSPPA